MELYEAMRTTHAVRDFTDDQLSDEILARILDNARFAPSGGNRQGAHVVVVRSRETRERMVELSATGARRYLAQQKAGEMPWNTVHPSAVTDDQIAATGVPRAMTEPLLTAAVVLVFLVDLGVVASIDSELDRVGLVSGASVYPLVWNTLLAARNEGFGGVITTMAVAEEPALLELLGAPEGHAVAAVVPLGRPVKQLTRLRRQPVEEFVTLETYAGTPLTDD
ncbi:nitroreductase family protein [Nocardioides albus]|uniref:Nitroreductase n=1 Tax=Nocardioides albus TaxID=1841 RepID=A0A7W5F914_9ACTN|nr:nitroreductase family protein [Nocardioides albus]MBB3089532.1 nitroreductase [Nocardioides albus]GGU31085.1 nitroreductase [Nocardioides albus]